MGAFNEYDSQQTLSDEQFQAVLADCNFSDEGQVKDLVAKTYTPHKFNEAVAEKHAVACGAYDYFSKFYPTRIWEDGQGQDEFDEVYYAPEIGYDFSRFIRTAQICDPATADECNTNYEQLPEGGRGALPPMEFYKWGVETPRQCIANVRHVRHFRQWSKRLLEGWYKTDQQIANMFFMFATIRMAGHKIVTQGEDTGNGIFPVGSADNKNPFGNFLYNYQEPMFPSINDADTIVPLEFQYLEKVARFWAHTEQGNEIGTSVRGEKVYEFWYPDDWYNQYVLQNPEYFEAIKHTMPKNLLAGYKLMNDNESEKEVLGNWSMKVMPCLPRFTESTEGGLIPIDNFVNENVEVGQRAVFDQQFLNAPFLMAIMPSPKAGEILYRPDLTTSLEGWPIMPILGRGGWTIRNDYDKDCNRDLNMPFAQRRYEIGFKMKDPDASMAVIFRNTVYRVQAANQCDWAPIVKKAPVAHDDFGIACGTNQRRAPQNVTATGLDEAVYIECDAHACGSGDGTLHRLKFTRKVENPNYLPFETCGCGDTISLVIVDGDGVNRSVDGVITETTASWGNWPDSMIWVQLDAALAEGECIRYAYCENDDELFEGGQVVVECIDDTVDEDLSGDLRLMIDGTINCDATDSAEVKYYDSDGVIIGSAVAVTIVSVNATKDVVVVSAAGDITCNADAVTTTITCV